MPPQEKQPQHPLTSAPEPTPRRAHTYDDDVAKAMNTTDATVVQELLATARAKEIAYKEYTTGIHQRKWYGVFSVLFLLLAAGGFGYALYHYASLTVPAEQQVSVGVFPSTAPVAIGTTDIRQTIAALAADPTLSPGKPVLVPLVTDATTLTPVSKEQFFSFIEAAPTEPFAASIGVIRLGAVNTGKGTMPFIVLSVPDAQIASKEFLIAEPSLLSLFYRALAIDLATQTPAVGTTFTSDYLSNLPVRMLSVTTSEGVTSPVLLYGYAAADIIVITTSPQVLTAVYDTIIRQQ